ncbi:MAG: hypothetical protein FWG91_05175 [Lachnospiraceae bacterium]|nr:hypothetical protein [Lachnospiraceae bacterium]
MIAWLKKNADKIPLYLFYLGLTIELLVVIIDRSALPPLNEGQIFRVTFLLFAIKVCFTKYAKKEWLVLFSFLLFTFIMYRITGQNVALRAVVFVAAMRDIKIRVAMKYTFWLTLSGFLSIIALSVIGIGRDLKLTTVYRDVIETRYHFGIGHPNTFYCMVLAVLLLFFYCYQEKLKMSILSVILGANIVLFIFTDSRTGFFVTTVAILLAMVFTLAPKLAKTDWVYYAAMGVFLLCIGLSVLAAYYADSLMLWTPGSLLERLDQALSSRIIALYWDRPSISAALKDFTLFASNAEYVRSFDMGWVRFFYWFGIVPGTLFIGLFLLLLNECRRQKDVMALLLIVVIAIYTIVEPQFISLYLGRNFLLFIFGAYWGKMLIKDDGKEVYWWQIGYN